MPRRQFQNAHQWPNRVQVRRDHPLTRDIAWALFPVLNPQAIAGIPHNLNQVRSSPISSWTLTASTADQGHARQPYSYFYTNQYLSRYFIEQGGQLQIGSDRSWTVLWNLWNLNQDPSLMLARGAASGTHPIFGSSASSAGVHYATGQASYPNTGLTVTTPFNPVTTFHDFGFSFHSTKRMRGYCYRHYNETPFVDADFGMWADDPTNHWYFSAILFVKWAMAWQRELSPAEVYEVFRNPAVVLAQAPIRTYSLPPVMGDFVNPVSIAAVASIPTIAVDEGLEVNPLSIMGTVTLPNPVLASASLGLTPASIAAEASVPTPALLYGLGRGLKITITDRLAEG